MKKLFAAISILGVLLLLGSSLLATAQTSDGCPDGTNCINADNFDSDVNGWVANDDGLSLKWQASQSTTFGSSGTGLIYVSGANPNGYTIRKTFNLGVGTYQIKFRAHDDFSLNSQSIYVWINYTTLTYDVSPSAQLSPWYYTEFTSGQFQIASPGPVSIQIVTKAPTFYDYIWIEKIPDTEPTPTPYPYFHTATPRPGTPIPTEAQATPQPTATPYCQPKPTGVAQFNMTPSPTPPGMAPFLDTFKDGINSAWNATGHDVYVSSAMDHTGNGNSGSAYIGYNGFPTAQATASALNEALILQDNFSNPFYVNLWAQADVVPVGETGYVEIWTLTATTWTRAAQFPISAGRWYPIFATISGAPSAIAFIGSRSDGPVESSGTIFIDDVYIYPSTNLAPYCDGSYAPTVNDVSGENISGLQYTDLYWPADRPCPQFAPVPNNFWGPLLNGIALFIDQIFAWAPLHAAGWMPLMVTNTLLSPVGVMFTFCAILFDWTVPLYVLGIWLGIQSIYWAIMAWRIIRYSTVE
jgi:hypothetical protein